MKHWGYQYIGQEYTDQKDCFVWFCEWRDEHFNDKITLQINGNSPLLKAKHYMNDTMASALGWVPTDEPKEGDAVFLTLGTRPHHIGMVVFPVVQKQVLHAVPGIGVILSNMFDLRINGWGIKGFYTLCK